MHRYFWRFAGVAFLALGVATACQASATPPAIDQQQGVRVYPSPAGSPTLPPPTPTVIYLTPPRR